MEKRVVLGGGGGERRPDWEGMNPEILALIFVRIPADMMSRTVPLVCWSWQYVVAGPDCWIDIDIGEWCRRVSYMKPEVIDPAVRRLVRRSKGNFRRLSAYHLGNPSFGFVASFGRHLNILQIPRSDITDEMVEKHAPSLATLTVLDISFCEKMTSRSIEALGRHCRSLVQLRRNIRPLEFDLSQPDLIRVMVEEEEAMAIANTMPGLEHLDLGYGHFTDLGLCAILEKCVGLRHLDIRGCWNVKMEGDIEQRCDRIKDFTDPWLEDEYYDVEVSSGSDGGKSGDDDAGSIDVDATDESEEDG